MRVAHVVTLMSPDDGAYGGPLRVALNQADSLMRRGHDVVVAAGFRGRTPPEGHLDGVQLKLFRAYALGPGFAGLLAPGLANWLRRQRNKLDVVHVHAGRDLTSMAALMSAGRRVPTVVQTHGMVAVTNRAAVRGFDVLLTRRLIPRASAVLSLTPHEDEELLAVLPAVESTRLINGVPTVDGSHAQEDLGQVEVLYLSRLHRRKRPLAFVDVALQLREKYPAVRWSIVGPDHGQLAALQRRIQEADASSTIRYEGAVSYDAVLNRLRRASIYVLPSVDEPFPMTVLEALSVGVPTVCTTSCGLADCLAKYGAAVVTSPEVAALSRAVDSLLSDREMQRRLATAGRAAVESEFSMERVAERLEHVYERAVSVRS